MLDAVEDDDDDHIWSSADEALLDHPVTWNDFDYHDVIGVDNLSIIDQLNSSLWSNGEPANNSSSGGGNETTHYSTWQIAVLATLAGVTSLVTIGGNLIVILSFIVERSIRQPTNYFIASLAVSDLLIGSVSMPFYTVYLLAGQRWPLGEILCDLWLSVDYTVCLCSIYTVFCITIDRFCSVKIPARYRDWRTENKVLAMVAVTWAVPVLVFFTSIFGWQYFVGMRTVPEGKCYVQYMEAALFNCLLQIGYFWITLTIMCALYTGIYQVVLNLSRKSEAKQKKLTTMVNMVGSALKMRTTTNGDDPADPAAAEAEQQGRLRIPPNRNEADDDDSGASDDLEMTRKQKKPPQLATKTNRKRLSQSDSDRSHSSGRSPIAGRRKATGDAKGGKATGDAKSRSGGNGDRRNQQRPTGGRRTLFFGQRKNGGVKKNSGGGGGGGAGSRDTSLRQAIVISDVNEVTRPTNICLVLPDAEGSSSEQRNDPLTATSLSNQDLTQQQQQQQPNRDTGDADKDAQGRSNHGPGSSSSSLIGNNTLAPIGGAMTLQVPGQSTHALHPSRDDFTQQRSLSATTLDLLTVRTALSRKSSAVSMLSRRCSRSPSAIGPINFRRWSDTKASARPKEHRNAANSSENRARKALRTITVILGAFVLCWTPWHVLSMVISFCPEDRVCVEPLLYDISYWLCYLNSPINPLCYALANQQFKKTFIRIIKLDFHRR